MKVQGYTKCQFQIIELEPRPPSKKKMFFWTNPYKIEVIITPLIEILALTNLVTWSNLQHNLSHVIKLCWWFMGKITLLQEKLKIWKIRAGQRSAAPVSELQFSFACFFEVFEAFPCSATILQTFCERWVMPYFFGPHGIVKSWLLIFSNFSFLTRFYENINQFIKKSS